MPQPPRIRILQEGQAEGELAELYQSLRETFGMPFVPDVFKLASIRPDLLRVLRDGYRAMFFAGPLPRPVKELIATTVSSANSCEY
jgi:alkylhydroperoxidase family enzyme